MLFANWNSAQEDIGYTSCVIHVWIELEFVLHVSHSSFCLENSLIWNVAWNPYDSVRIKDILLFHMTSSPNVNQ